MKPERLRRFHSRVDGLARAAVSDNRAHRLATRAILLLLAGALAPGCSMTVPLAGLEPDTASTGSINRTVALLSPELDQEDVRRAKAALAIALDPQGNGARVAWQNPQTSAHGAFTASGSPFVEHDRVCRAFTGEEAPTSGSSNKLAGSACRDGDGTWQIRSNAGTKA